MIATFGLNSPLRLVHEFRNIHKLLWIFFILFYYLQLIHPQRTGAMAALILYLQNYKDWFLNQCSRISSYDAFEITLIIFFLYVNKSLDKGTMF